MRKHLCCHSLRTLVSAPTRSVALIIGVLIEALPPSAIQTKPEARMSAALSNLILIYKLHMIHCMPICRKHRCTVSLVYCPSGNSLCVCGNSEANKCTRVHEDTQTRIQARTHGNLNWLLIKSQSTQLSRGAGGSVTPQIWGTSCET